MGVRLRNLGALLADRWQIPAALLAVVAVGFALQRIKPERPEVPFETLLADVVALAQAGHYQDAADAAANLLAMEPPLPREQRAVLHDTLADVLIAAERLRPRPIPHNLELVLKHHAEARRLGAARGPSAALRVAQAHEWLGHRRQAIEAYQALLARNPAPDARREALQGLVRLLGDVPEEEAQRRAYLEALLSEPQVSLPYLWWALRHAVREALRGDDLERARDLVGRFGSRFLEAGLDGFYDYLLARVQFALGDLDAASATLDAASRWLRTNPPIDEALDRSGYLPAMVEALRGRLHLADLRPQAALQSLERALNLEDHGEVFVDAALDRLRALAMLERHVRARAELRRYAEHLSQDPAAWATARDRLRNVALELARTNDARRDYTNAIAYLECALELTPEDQEDARRDLLERLAGANEVAADEAPDAATSRRLHAAAARYFERAAELSLLDETRYTALLWSAAQHYDLAGRIEDAQRTLRQFAETHPVDPRLPQALLRLGQACAAQGALQDALRWYEDLIRRFPRLEEASRARLLRANILAALGEGHYPEAERMLLDLLQGELVAPQAQVYRDALTALCDLYVQSGRYADAISYIETFLGLYPNDEHAGRMRFLLADAYRRSAYALRDRPPSGAAAQRARHESARRFERAADLFGNLLADLSDGGDAALYRRLALFYRADCLYELNRPDTLAEALMLYREAAARYQGQPASLTAHVQMANIYLRQGRVREAASAIERARWQLAGIAPEAFASREAERSWWAQFLEGVSGAEMFRSAIVAGP